MKYNIENIVIPMEKRKEINDKILYMLDNGLFQQHGVTPNDVFNSYSGDGGLHGLNFKDYNSYYEFGEAKKEVEQGQFFTNHNICKFMIDILKPHSNDLVADICSGIGNFANYIPEHNIYMNEIDIKSYKVAKYLYPDAHITNNDMKYYNLDVKLDVVIGNPPFNIKINAGNEEYMSQFYFCIKSYELLKPSGIMFIIVPNSFMNDEFSDKGVIDKMNSMYNFIMQFNLPKNAFKEVGVDTFETKVMLFQKKSEYIEDKPYTFDKIDVVDFTEQTANKLYATYVKPLYDTKQSLKAKLYFENVQRVTAEDFTFKVKKLLYDIQVNTKLNKWYADAESYYIRFLTEKKPEGMDYKEWDKKKLTENKVIAYMKAIFKKGNRTEKDIIELVKTNYGLKLKAYSRKTQLQLSKMEQIKEMSMNDMLYHNNYPFEDGKYKKLFNRKLKQYYNQDVSFKEMQEDNSIKSWLDNFTIHNKVTAEDIKLNDIQKHDINLVLQKNYSYLQWSMGTGKSLAGIAYMLYRQQNNNTINSFVVAPSIAINNTWCEILEQYEIPFIQVKSLEDINNIKKNDIVLFTFNMLCKYQRHVKKYLKSITNKFTFVLDEADSVCNLTSKRTKAVMNCFQGRGKYKLLLSGTSTRNSISEVYTAFQLLYNSSVNFISESQYLMVEDSKTKELLEESNPMYMKSYPNYQKGLTLFKQSHIPQKITVFGVGQNTQDIYNADILKSIVDKTIITRTFEEIVGKKIYELVQDTVKFNDDERSLYHKAINEFYNMKYLFSSTGNIRKDRMLEIIQQLNLLLDICSHPQTYKEYGRTELPNKYKKVLSMLDDWKGERVAIGCRNIKAVECYAAQIRSKYPDRELFIITGNSTTMKQRREICDRLKESSNGILLSTQQSLSSSMNIDFVNKVIIPDHSWNYATESQYFFRFIRLTSKEFKEVHFVSYENSLESNLQMLIVAKEKLNMFLKDTDINDDELQERFGIDFNILDMLLSKERDENGRVNIRWGEQKVC